MREARRPNAPFCIRASIRAVLTHAQTTSWFTDSSRLVDARDTRSLSYTISVPLAFYRQLFRRTWLIWLNKAAQNCWAYVSSFLSFHSLGYFSNFYFRLNFGTRERMAPRLIRVDAAPPTTRQSAFSLKTRQWRRECIIFAFIFCPWSSICGIMSCIIFSNRSYRLVLFHLCLI